MAVWIRRIFSLIFADCGMLLWCGPYFGPGRFFLGWIRQRKLRVSWIAGRGIVGVGGGGRCWLVSSGRVVLETVLGR